MTKTQKQNKISKKEVAKFRGQMLKWYDLHARDLPWRSKDDKTLSPYHIWLSEIMLQQTTVSAVTPYYIKFIHRWPDIKSLAAAPQEEILNAWAGLGYYARARNLYACAQVVAYELDGIFPDTQKALKKLPGIGDYTSAAIRAIAFNKEAVVVDGNIERIMARYFAVQEPLPRSKTQLKEFAAHFFKGFDERPGDLAQSLMDLGAGPCIVKSPRCLSCPLQEKCRGYKMGLAADLPRKEKKKLRPQKYGEIYWLTNDKEEVLLHRRPSKGLLGGMLGLPTSQWLEEQAVHQKPHSPSMSIHHSFTHFDLELFLHNVLPSNISFSNESYFWFPIEKIRVNEFPTVFKKVITLFMNSRD